MHSFIEINRLDEAPYKSLKTGMVRTPIGSAVLVWDDVGVRELSLSQNPADILDALTASGVSFVHDDRQAVALLAGVFNAQDLALPLVLCGTAFQRQVWLELMLLRLGQTISYGELAHRLGKPTAARAVGSAVGANLLGFVVPCHRVIRQDGVIGQFRWGTEVKRRLLAWEAEMTQ